MMQKAGTVTRSTYHSKTTRASSTPHMMKAKGARESSTQKNIKLIVSDVDGTLLNSKQELTSGVQSALANALKAGVPTVLATGKAPGPWRQDVLPKLPRAMPIVYLQGLLVQDSDTSTIYERVLDTSIIEKGIAYAKEKGITLTMYCNDRILCEAVNKHTNRLIFYKEPTPEAVGDLSEWVGKISVHKQIFLSEDEDVPLVWSDLEQLFGNKVSLTKALPGMVEVLPRGESKGASVARVLDMLEIDPQHMMAIGDGDNDLEMLDLAGVAIAMGNAGAKVKEVADFVVSTNDEDGVEEAIKKFVLNP